MQLGLGFSDLMSSLGLGAEQVLSEFRVVVMVPGFLEGFAALKRLEKRGKFSSTRIFSSIFCFWPFSKILTGMG